VTEVDVAGTCARFGNRVIRRLSRRGNTSRADETSAALHCERVQSRRQPKCGSQQHGGDHLW
jgi:hypothetical protein